MSKPCKERKQLEKIVIRSIFVNGGSGGGVIFQQQTLFLLVRKNIKKTTTLVVTCTVDAIKRSLITEMIQCLTGSAV